MDYNVHYKKFERIVCKNEPIVKQDNILGPMFLAVPQFIIKKAPSLQDLVVAGVIDPPSQAESRLFSFLKGFYACGRHSACWHSRANDKKQK